MNREVRINSLRYTGDLDPWIVNILLNNGIETVGQLMDKKERQLWRYKGFGAYAIKKIESFKLRFEGEEPLEIDENNNLNTKILNKSHLLFLAKNGIHSEEQYLMLGAQGIYNIASSTKGIGRAALSRFLRYYDYLLKKERLNIKKEALNKASTALKEEINSLRGELIKEREKYQSMVKLKDELISFESRTSNKISNLMLLKLWINGRSIQDAAKILDTDIPSAIKAKMAVSALTLKALFEDNSSFLDRAKNEGFQDFFIDDFIADLYRHDNNER